MFESEMVKSATSIREAIQLLKNGVAHAVAIKKDGWCQILMHHEDLYRLRDNIGWHYFNPVSDWAILTAPNTTLEQAMAILGYEKPNETQPQSFDNTQEIGVMEGGE